MTESLVHTSNLSKKYLVGPNIVNALSDASISIKSGEMIAVMGPSGSGKTTFMNLLGCLDKPSSGKYFFEGNEVSSLNSNQLAALRNQRIGFVFQSFNLLPRITALENVALPLAYGKYARSIRKKMAIQALDEVGLSDRVDHTPVQLSGGQQQRVAIARALVGNPSLILADEPTGALDTSTGKEIMNLLSKLNDKNITIILVTHEAEVANYAQRIIHFRDGRVIREEANN